MLFRCANMVPLPKKTRHKKRECGGTDGGRETLFCGTDRFSGEETAAEEGGPIQAGGRGGRARRSDPAAHRRARLPAGRMFPHGQQGDARKSAARGVRGTAGAAGAVRAGQPADGGGGERAPLRQAGNADGPGRREAAEEAGGNAGQYSGGPRKRPEKAVHPAGRRAVPAPAGRQ